MKKALLIALGLAMMAAIMLAPTPAGLSVAGQRMIGIMVFTVFIWITEAIPYGASAISLVFLIILFLGFAPAHGTSGPLLGTSRSIPLALNGFSNSGWLFVATGLAIAASITSTGLEKRIAFVILRFVGTRVNAMMMGIIVTSFVLTFVIPSVIARAATMVPIVLGIIHAFDLPKDSQIGKAMLLLAGIMPSVTGAGVLSGAAPNPIIITFLVNAGLPQVGYLDWLIALFPYTVAYSVFIYFLITRMFKFEYDEFPGGKQYLDSCIAELGPMSVNEKKVSIIMVFTILLWATDKFHHIDAAAVSVLAVLLLVLPWIGVTTWNELYKRLDWTSILLFGAGISMAEMFTRTGGATWLAKIAFVNSGLGNLPITLLAFAIFFVTFLIRFCFTSITSCITAITPAILGFLIALHNPFVPVLGIIFGASLVAQCTAIIPVTSAPAMIAYGAGGFTVKDMIRVGIPMAVVMYVLLLVQRFTYWPMIGLWH